MAAVIERGSRWGNSRLGFLPPLPVTGLSFGYQTQTPVTRCLVLPRSKRLNMRTMVYSLLSLRFPSFAAVRSRSRG